MEIEEPIDLSYTNHNIPLAIFYEKALIHYHKKDFLESALMLQKAAMFTGLISVQMVLGASEKCSSLAQIKKQLLKGMPEVDSLFKIGKNPFSQQLKSDPRKITSDATAMEKEILDLLEIIARLRK